MCVSSLKIFSCLIFIAKQKNFILLTLLLKEYIKTKVSPTQYIFILMLVKCYENNNIFIDHNFFKILENYIHVHSEIICKHLIYAS